MSLASRMQRVVSVTTFADAGTTNLYGDAVLTSTVTEYRGWVSQVGSSEDSIQRETATATYLVLLPAEAVIDNTSVVELDDDGRTYRVVGIPNEVHNSRGLHHIEVTIEEIVG
jgi:hypothetical protein